jgi:hypothetical protein
VRSRRERARSALALCQLTRDFATNDARRARGGRSGRTVGDVLRLAFVLAVLALLAAAPLAHAGSWKRPVDGLLLRGFALGSDPYEGGWHRGVDLAAARGSPVRSACPGPVSFAGRVPRGGLTVSVRCGAVVATYQQLGSVAVRTGRHVRRGTQLGSVGRSSDPRERRSHVHLGVRELRTGRYLDPLDFMRGASPPAPLPPAARTPPADGPLGLPPGLPRAARPALRTPQLAPARSRRVAPRGSPLRAPRPYPGAPLGAAPRVPAQPWRARRHGLPAMPTRLTPAPKTSPPAAIPGVPWPVWVGLASFGLGLPFGGFVRLRRRRHAAIRVASTA